MAHLFLSHATEDKAKANLVRLALEKHGFHVWWHENVIHGERWEQRIESALTGASAVIVIWSHHSVDSPWVCHEASYAKLNQTAVQIQVDKCDVLPHFASHQHIDFSNWDEREDSSQMQALVRAVRTVHRKLRRERLSRLMPFLVSAGAATLAIFCLFKMYELGQRDPISTEVAKIPESKDMMFETLVITIAFGDSLKETTADIHLSLAEETTDLSNELIGEDDSGSHAASDGKNLTAVLNKKDGKPMLFGKEILATWILPQNTEEAGTFGYAHLHSVTNSEHHNQIEICGSGRREQLCHCTLFVVYSPADDENQTFNKEPSEN